MWTLSYFKEFLFVALFSFSLTFLLILVARIVFPRIGLMDRPQKYGLKREPIPYYGGLIIFISFLVSVLFFVNLDLRVIGLLIGSSIIVLLGFMDDLFGIKPWKRLVVQFIAVLILIFSGIGILSINLPFLGVLDLTAINFSFILFGCEISVLLFGAVFMILWVMAIVNSMNFLDGISGLNSGVTFIASLAIFFLSIRPQIHEDPASQFAVAMLALILAFTALAFCFFDFPKARILMGDTGSTFFGFMLATLAIFSGGKLATAFLVLGIPIMDMVWVVIRRTLEGRKFWEGDLKHFHHRLLNIGFSERKVLFLYYSVSIIFALLALFLSGAKQKFFMLLSLLVLMLLFATTVVLVLSKKKLTKK